MGPTGTDSSLQMTATHRAGTEEPCRQSPAQRPQETRTKPRPRAPHGDIKSGSSNHPGGWVSGSLREEPGLGEVK